MKSPEVIVNIKIRKEKTWSKIELQLTFQCESLVVVQSSRSKNRPLDQVNHISELMAKEDSIRKNLWVKKLVNMLMMLNMLKMKKRVAKRNHKLESVETRAAHSGQPTQKSWLDLTYSRTASRTSALGFHSPQLAAHDAKEEEKGGGFWYLMMGAFL